MPTLAVALLILSLALTGCSRVRALLDPPPTPVPPVVQPIVEGDPVVDGWPVGGVSTDCVAKKLCSAIIDVGRSELDADNPGHAAVVDATVHDLGIAVDAQSRLVPWGISGTIWIVLFTLADGKTSAVDVSSAITTCRGMNTANRVLGDEIPAWENGRIRDHDRPVHH